MKKAKKYPARLILFGDEFSENLPDWLEGIVEEYDLTQPTALRFCEEASILHDYVSYFDKEYKQARIVYHFNEKGLTLHRLYTFGPCFKVASLADSQKLQRYSKQLYRFIEIDDLCYQSILIIFTKENVVAEISCRFYAYPIFFFLAFWPTSTLVR